MVEKLLNEVYGSKYKIPLDFEMLTEHAPLYKAAIDEDIIFEITFNQNDQVLKSTKIKDMAYKLTNICLEYDTFTDQSIASTIAQQYSSGYAFMYDKVDHLKTEKVTNNETDINQNINIPRRSVKGVLILFEKAFDTGTRETEHFYNPKIKKVDITIEGIGAQLYDKGLKMMNQWEEAKKFFMSQKSKWGLPYYMNDKKFYHKGFGLWIDFRSTGDNSLHGSGTKIQNTKDGIQLCLKKKSGEGPYKMYIFVVSDAQINIANCQLRAVQF